VALDERYRWIYRNRVLDASGREQTVGIGIGAGDDSRLVIVNSPPWYAAHAATIDDIAFGMQSASGVVRQESIPGQVAPWVRGESLDYRSYRIRDLNGHAQALGIFLPRDGGGIELRGPRGDWGVLDAATAYAMGSGLVTFSRQVQEGS
jgi:hypothetical protein